MQQFHTEREQRFIDLAATLADDFATRAAQHDEEGSFPYENYERLKETGYSVLTIPEELGGMGASLLERIKAQERLAQGCGPTALAINMHFNVMSLLINLWQRKRPRSRRSHAASDRGRAAYYRRLGFRAGQRGFHSSSADHGGTGGRRLAGERP